MSFVDKLNNYIFFISMVQFWFNQSKMYSDESEDVDFMWPEAECMMGRKWTFDVSQMSSTKGRRKERRADERRKERRKEGRKEQR